MISECPACLEKRLHQPAETQEFHPYAGHGFQEGLGWTHPDLAVVLDSSHDARTPGADPPRPPAGIEE